MPKRNTILLVSFFIVLFITIAWLVNPPLSYASKKLGAVIPLSSIESSFAEDTIREALGVATPVVVVYADHLSDGSVEDLSYIESLKAALKGTENEASLLWVPVAWFPGRSSRFWVRYLRWAGFPFIPLDVDYVAWFDADEVLDAARFKAWWASPKGLPAMGHEAVKLGNYVYFRETAYQSEQLEDSVVVCKRSGLTAGQFFEDPGKEREMFFDGKGSQRMILALDGQPMVHHFSWVRSKAGMLKKVRAWGHNDDPKHWQKMVEAEFSHPFTGKDFINGHTYRTLAKPWIDAIRETRGKKP